MFSVCSCFLAFNDLFQVSVQRTTNSLLVTFPASTLPSAHSATATTDIFVKGKLDYVIPCLKPSSSCLLFLAWHSRSHIVWVLPADPNSSGDALHTLASLGCWMSRLSSISISQHCSCLCLVCFSLAPINLGFSSNMSALHRGLLWYP